MGRLVSVAVATGIATAVIIVGCACTPAIAQLSPNLSPQFPLRMSVEKHSCPTDNEEVSKQEEIYHSKKEKVPQGYIIDRSLLAYKLSLSSGFDRSLASLGPTDRWLDVGAGQGEAILDYYTQSYDLMSVDERDRHSKKARAVAISIEDRRTPRWHKTAAALEANQVRYLHGRYLRQYSLAELGRFQVITDVLGGFSYTEHLSQFMEKVLSSLELGGSFYTILQDVGFENGTNRPVYPDTSFATEIVDANGSDVKVCSWLKRITCVEVTCEIKAALEQPAETYHVHKICSDVSVPALEPIHFRAGTPPERRFQLENRSLTSLSRSKLTR